MIYEDDLNQAIAEAKAERDPNAWTCIRLAAFYIIKEQLFGDSGQLPPDYAAAPMVGASFADAPTEPPEEIVQYTSVSAFGQAIDGKRAAQIWPILDELMSYVQTLYPDLYDAAMRKLKTL